MWGKIIYFKKINLNPEKEIRRHRFGFLVENVFFVVVEESALLTEQEVTSNDRCSAFSHRHGGLDRQTSHRRLKP